MAQKATSVWFLLRNTGLLFAVSAYVSGHKGLKMAPGLVCLHFWSQGGCLFIT